MERVIYLACSWRCPVNTFTDVCFITLGGFGSKADWQLYI